MSGQPQLEPPTERVGGGLSARMTALATGALLVGVVWLGVSGRSDQATPAASPVPTAVGQPIVTPDQRPATASPEPAFTPDPPLGFGEIVHGEDAYGITAWFNDRFYMVVLRESQDGHLRATMRLPFTQLAASTELSIIQLWTREDRPDLAAIGAHQLGPNWLVPSDAPYTALFDVTLAQTDRPDAPLLARHGYVLRVEVRPMDSYSDLVVDIQPGQFWHPLPLPEPAEPAPRFEAHLTGDGRLLSMVGLGARPPAVMTGHIILHDRYGRSPTLTLYHYPGEDDEAVSVFVLELDARLLRRGHPEGFAGRFSTDGGEANWDYRITPIGTGFGVLLVLEVELVDRPAVEGASGLLQT